MLYLTCTTITSIDLAHYRVSRAKDWVSVKCGKFQVHASLLTDFDFYQACKDNHWDKPSG